MLDSSKFIDSDLAEKILHNKEIQCPDCTILDSTGVNAFAIGEEGFQASAGTTMNVDEQFCLPEEAKIENYSEHEYSFEITHVGISEFHGIIGTSDDTSRSWQGISDGISLNFENFGDGRRRRWLWRGAAPCP